MRNYPLEYLLSICVLSQLAAADSSHLDIDKILPQNKWSSYPSGWFQQFYLDYKTILQEYSQRKWHLFPNYTTISEEGPDHDKIFNVKVVVIIINNAGNAPIKNPI